jgi:hypothetical protein
VQDVAGVHLSADAFYTSRREPLSKRKTTKHSNNASLKLTHDLTEKFSILLNSSEPICHILCFTYQKILYSGGSRRSMLALFATLCAVPADCTSFREQAKAVSDWNLSRPLWLITPIQNIASALRISTFVPRKIFSNSSRGFE